MQSVQGAVNGNIERFPTAAPLFPITDELNRILVLLREAAAPGSTISFDFDGRLQVHIDVRKREDMIMLERQLTMIEHGLFHGIKIGNTPNHPFFHRISAMVNA